MRAKNFFTEIQQQHIVNAISSAELNTSGEIRLHIVDSCKNDPKDEAILIFEKLGMTKTELRNGVLIYLAVADKKFAIIGDKGINEVVEADFWDSIRDEIIFHFKKNDFETGLINGIAHVGEKLKKHFPYAKNDENELSNDISFEA
ncbi:MAG: TPM domain-containing protein [Bacteroidota bacterium]